MTRQEEIQTFDSKSNLKVINTDFLFEVANWKVEWFSSMSLIWINPNLQISSWSQQTVSQQWGQYTFPVSAVELYISSTDTWDTTNTFILNLLDEDYNEVNVTVTPNWQSAVQVPNWPYFRFNWGTNITWNITQWDIYVSSSSSNSSWVPNANTVLWMIKFESYWSGWTNTDSSAERFHNSIYTVPAWKTLFTYNIRAWLGKNKDSIVFIYIRPFGWVFIENIRYQLFEWNFENALNPLTPIAEKTDIEFRATTSNNGTELTINASFILVDNNVL